MKASEVLDRAADLIEPEGAWTQGASFRNAGGDAVDGDSADVTCRCLVGAISAVTDYDFSVSAPAYPFLEKLVADDAAVWNDKRKRTQPETIHMMHGRHSGRECDTDQ